MDGPNMIQVLVCEVRECQQDTNTDLARLRQVLQAFVDDIEVVHGVGAGDLEDEWFDLFLTYQIACATLEATRGMR